MENHLIVLLIYFLHRTADLEIRKITKKRNLSAALVSLTSLVQESGVSTGSVTIINWHVRCSSHTDLS